jgi:O-antigen ligase
LSVPLFLALGFAGRRSWWRLASLAVGAAGVCGVVATMSRLPTVLMAGQIILLGICLVAMRRSRVEQWIGLGAMAALVVACAALPFADQIYDRIVGNWDQSVDFRGKVNNFAYRKFEENPISGIGLNHFTSHMLKMNPSYRKMYDKNVEAAKEVNVRYMLAVHNAYLLVLAEMGAPGFIAFVILLASILASGVIAVRSCRGDVRIACLGMTIGLLGMYTQGLTEYAMVVEQDMYPLLLVGVLLHFAPRIESVASPERAT